MGFFLLLVHFWRKSRLFMRIPSIIALLLSGSAMGAYGMASWSTVWQNKSYWDMVFFSTENFGKYCRYQYTF